MGRQRRFRVGRRVGRSRVAGQDLEYASGDLQPIQNDGGGVTVIDPSGDVDILANLFSGSGFPVWSIVDDAGGPALDGLAVPARGTVGVPIDFAVTPIDAWSAISSTHWSFGDGSAATDESVSHVYAKAGTYTIGTSSSDILGQHGEPDLEDRDRCCPPTGTGPSPPTKRTAATRLTLRVPLRRTAAGGRRSSPPRRVHLPAGTRFGLAVNQAARVTLTFSQTVQGRRLHGRCRAPTMPATGTTRAACAPSSAASSRCASPRPAGARSSSRAVSALAACDPAATRSRFARPGPAARSRAACISRSRVEPAVELG